ncbi:GNAT family N-acetyltransferase [Halobacillus yeomjeoni]|uniref:GNAT family N-acetyltransferase n=1 Tax=Halobacillus yeomjeoni TaxID=311194 RepID=A0A931MUA0_9BACI|nr:GNAT family protein [Halobacillus yeomjeoni]MBH0229738.1 GNAT family N-acetyltransferase [Halobacillus yeomjeoni]
MVEIIGEKLILMEASETDIDELYDWKFSEKGWEAKQWNGPYIPEEKMTRREYGWMWALDNNAFADIPDALVITVNQKVVGYVGAYWVDKNTNWLETGIVIYDSHYWNGGYGTEAYQLWIDFLFNHSGLHRLGMSTWSGNLRMIKVAEKLGMVEEARIRQAREVNGEYYDSIKMGILRSEWKGSKKKL